MSTTKPWKLVLLLAGIFIAGGLVGAGLMLHFGRDYLQRRAMPEQWGPARLQLLTRRLDLTPEQIEQLRPVVRRNMSELGRLRQEGYRETRRVLDRMEQDISAVLTPEQQAKFRELSDELRERSRRHMDRRRQHRERRGSGDAGDGPAGPQPPRRP
jgi:Spy/CpxP family protein refolding chaperone